MASACSAEHINHAEGKSTALLKLTTKHLGPLGERIQQALAQQACSLRSPLTCACRACTCCSTLADTTMHAEGRGTALLKLATKHPAELAGCIPGAIRDELTTLVLQRGVAQHC